MSEDVGLCCHMSGNASLALNDREPLNVNTLCIDLCLSSNRGQIALARLSGDVLLHRVPR